MSNYIKGVDISTVQQTVDFAWLKQHDIKFVVVRCAVGNDGTDAKYASNIAAAKAAGLKVMAYHFLYPLPSDAAHPTRDPKIQAQTHFKAANGELAAIDLEWPSYQDWGKWGCSAAQINQWALDYMAEYERLDGRKPLLYTYPSFAKLVKFSAKMAEYPLWIASYTSSPTIPSPWTDWVMWQNAGGDALKLPNGIPVDTNVCKDLSLWGDYTKPVPEQSMPVAPPQSLPEAPAVVPATQEPTPVVTPPEAPLVAPKAPISFKSNPLVDLFRFLLKLIGVLK
jgi:hypothetical protein